jgi:hypothetical protein
MNDGFSPLWSVSAPALRAGAPEWMSFHFFVEAERCPRAAMLKSSSYPTLWEGRGYPKRLNAAALTGLVIHAATEIIVKAFINAGVTSMSDPKTMDCLRDLGGYLAVLSRTLEVVVASESGNPRFQRTKAAVTKTLKMQLPRMRESVQQVLVSRAWKLSGSSNRGNSMPGTNISRVRYPLPDGSHFEVDLFDRSMMWRGRADLVTVTPSGCGVVDWKTGNQVEEHHRQMQVYALLWDGDRELNPSRLPIESLTLSYGGLCVQVDVPRGDQLIASRRLLSAKTTNIRTEFEMEPVPARPSDDNCRFCQVKLLCDGFWAWSDSSVREKDGFNDLELTLIRLESESSWIAGCNLTSVASKRVLLKKSQCDEGLWMALRPGLKLRMSDAMVTFREVGEDPLVAFTTFTEALLVES